ncbi:hypothetical protein [Acinetobacter larvae]|uniref:Uncharacterized protein n=1 Tax=Acinetobacter larvae TaxID=1789224 RepID=A0A1B2M498_9GAMM|nr:hypothetical protein [Acinetobacter larvae]AOA59873.1 hypothetical protein BFG52_04790 [Acinetobacter larvae]
MNTIKLAAVAIAAGLLAACQSTPSQFNGTTGYQIEQKNADSAVLVYTLAARKDRQLDENKLQHACQKVLKSNQTFKLKVLSITEIANPANDKQDQYGIKLGNSRTSIGLANTPSTNNSEGYAAQQILETRPSTLHVVRYTCTSN